MKLNYYKIGIYFVCENLVVVNLVNIVYYTTN